MSSSQTNFDFTIIGAGVVGLSLAAELLKRGHRRILIVEKEPQVGAHASGRNSGVLHAGIYYSHDSLKAKLCVEGRKHWVEFAKTNGVPLLECGKVIVATRPETVATLETLKTRSKQNGVRLQEISLGELRELEPEAHSFERALWSPDTAVIDSKKALEVLKNRLIEGGVEIRFATKLEKVDLAQKKLMLSRKTQVGFGYLLNAGGAHADRIAHLFGVGRNYRILPFKGLYWRSQNDFASRIRHLVYPAPDLGMPFLGVHLTKNLAGEVLFGPTAIPAFGRENYSALGGLDFAETPAILGRLTQMMAKNPGNFRSYVKKEMLRYWPREFYREAKGLVPKLKPTDIGAFAKVGIRAQLMDIEKKCLEMDFVVREGPSSMHVLNAISPAFTSAPACARYVVDHSTFA